MLNTPTTGYVTLTIATATTLMTTTTTSSSSVTPRPWHEFLDLSTFSLLYSYDDAMIQPGVGVASGYQGDIAYEGDGFGDYQKDIAKGVVEGVGGEIWKM
ncbi:PRA1 family protein E [Spatholobus suberectus]|nr:PRA1 family protein E [Spatholobus suberectus]